MPRYHGFYNPGYEFCENKTWARFDKSPMKSTTWARFDKSPVKSKTWARFDKSPVKLRFGLDLIKAM